MGFGLDPDDEFQETDQIPTDRGWRPPGPSQVGRLIMNCNCRAQCVRPVQTVMTVAA